VEFKVLLLVDNAGGHAADLSYDGVQIEFLPPNTTSLIQTMDQGIIHAFKALYTPAAHNPPGCSLDEVQHSAVDTAVNLAKQLGETAVMI
uniref:DDE-1 domain-containing protein n=1 Tax=Neogobius melanostomus TaxID=47308 RepID=A0A8C6T7D2_9GOBI